MSMLAGLPARGGNRVPHYSEDKLKASFNSRQNIIHICMDLLHFAISSSFHLPVSMSGTLVNVKKQNRINGALVIKTDTIRTFTMDHNSTNVIPPPPTSGSGAKPSAATPGDRPTPTLTGKNAIKKYIGTGIRYAIPVAVSVCLVIWLFHKVNFHEVVATVKEGCNFFWVAMMMLLTMVSRMIRGVRWGLQLRAAGVRRMPVVCEWVTIWGAYALNIVFPQLGEAWR